MKDFPRIQRGNGIINDNLATLSEIMLATYNRVEEVEKTIYRVDKRDEPRNRWSFYLLIATTVMSAIALVVAVFK